MKRFLVLGVISLGMFLTVGPQAAYGQSTTTTCTGTIVSGVCIPGGTGLSSYSVEYLLMLLMNWLLGIFGFIAIIAFVISGSQYMLAAGDDSAAETAKRNMKYSIIGITVALSGFVIIYAIDQALSGNPYF